jgi:hypothetical protein
MAGVASTVYAVTCLLVSTLSSPLLSRCTHRSIARNRRCRIARTERLLPALWHRAQDPDNTLIIRLEPLRVGLGQIGHGRHRARRRVFLRAEDLTALEDGERLEGLTVVDGGGERGGEGEGQRGEEGETHGGGCSEGGVLLETRMNDR